MSDRKLAAVPAPKPDKELGSSRQLHSGGVHGGSDLDRWADALATLAGTVRRAFIGGVR